MNNLIIESIIITRNVHVYFVYILKNESLSVKLLKYLSI